MADEKYGTQKTIDLETIDKIRKNIGPISNEEALAMQKKLGGEILKEAPSNYEMPKSKKTSRPNPSDNKFVNNTPVSSTAVGNDNIKDDTPKAAHLPTIDSKEEKLMYNLMMSPAYKLKIDHGFLNFFYNLNSKNKEKLDSYYITVTLNNHIQNIKGLNKTVKTLIELAPPSYKQSVAFDSDLKFKFMKCVSEWTVNSLKTYTQDVQSLSPNITITDMIPLTKEIYRNVLKIAYLGEQTVSLLIKEIYSDLAQTSDMEKPKLQAVAKKGIREWVYIYNNVIKGMYPLLMRMTSSTYVDFPKFFLVQSKQILDFTGLSKYDLLSKKLENQQPKQEKTLPKNIKVEPPKPNPDVHISGQKDIYVENGLKILDQMFPKAGFNRMEQHPDFYAYFQPLYNFPEGLTGISPENPLPVTIILLYIIKDFLQGCRNIKFKLNEDDEATNFKDDFNTVISEWHYYYEVCFFQKMTHSFYDYLNSYFSPDRKEATQFEKDMLNNFLARTKLYFCPNYEYAAPSLMKIKYDVDFPPLFKRTDYSKSFLTIMCKRIDAASKTKSNVSGIENPWEKYHFDISNQVSNRLDIMLGYKKDITTTKATNANLLKYTLCVMSVLDWWINNPASPAYDSPYNDNNFYRKDPTTGNASYDVTLISNQNSLFIESMKARAAKKQS